MGGGEKKISGEGFISPKFFLMFQTEILEFRVILGPEKISEAREGNWGIIYYLYHFHGGAGQDYWGVGPWSLWPPPTTSLPVIID